MLVDDEINGTNGAAGVLKGKDATAKAYNSAPTAMLDLQAGRIRSPASERQAAGRGQLHAASQTRTKCGD